MVVGSGGSDLGLGGTAAFLELPFDPAAGDHEPRALGRGPCRAAKAIERLGKRVGADPMHLGPVGQAGPNGVDVGIDQTGNDGAAAEVDDARAGAGQRADCGRVPDAGDLAVVHRQCRRRCGLMGNDLAVDEDRIRRLRVRRCDAGQRRQPDKTADQPAAHRSFYNRCSVQLVSMNMFVEPCGVRRRTRACL